MKIKILIAIILINLVYSENKANKVAVIGTGYVGLVLGACLALNHEVICADIDSTKINLLNKGIIPIHEPNLLEIVNKTFNQNNLTFTTDLDFAIKQSEIIFIAVNTPMSEDGQADISAVKNVAEIIAKNLNSYKIICTKSTVPIGTSKYIKNLISNLTACDFDVVVNSEFLREGSAVYDFLNPSRVIIGAQTEKARKIMQDLYAPILKADIPVIYTDTTTAETIKYASNAFLALKITYINEISNLCDQTGADVSVVAKGMGLDNRIGSQFLTPGPGYGGSCFPKDTEALLFTAKQFGVDLELVDSTIRTNKKQKEIILKKVEKLLGDVSNKNIAVLGLAFKANTDDIRYSPAIEIALNLHSKGAKICAYDPAAMSNAKKYYPQFNYCESSVEAIKNADLVLILTEWDEFKKIDSYIVKCNKNKPLIVDARNILAADTLKELDIKYVNMGNASIK